MSSTEQLCDVMQRLLERSDPLIFDRVRDFGRKNSVVYADLEITRYARTYMRQMLQREIMIVMLNHFFDKLFGKL